MYGLAFAYMELGDMEPAQKHFQIVQGMEAPEELRSLARKGLREIAFEIRMRGQYGLDINDPKGDPCPAVAAGKDLLGAAAGVHQVRRLQEDRAGDGYRDGPGRGVRDGGETDGRG